MNHQPINTLKAGLTIDSVYLIDRLEISKKKNGESYASLTLRDSTGSINAVMWDNISPIVNGVVKQNNFAQIQGKITTYREELQLVISQIQYVPDEKINKECFLPASSIPSVQLLGELDEVIASVQDRDFKNLLQLIFQEDKELRSSFSAAPSALKMHQAYMGGLLEHTLAVCRLALSIAQHYLPFNQDLLITAALLHDLGKIHEFDYQVGIKYTDEGQLLGHLVIGLQVIQSKMNELGEFDENKKLLLTHAILSHHGEKEWGAPKRPKTIEALILHYADFIDSRLSTYMEQVKGGGKTGKVWTDYIKIFDRSLYIGQNSLEGDDQAENK